MLEKLTGGTSDQCSHVGPSAQGLHSARTRNTVDRAAAILIGAAALSTVFLVLALCNPWADGPTWLHWSLVPPVSFSSIYGRYFSLASLGLGRLLNVTAGL